MNVNDYILTGLINEASLRNIRNTGVVLLHSLSPLESDHSDTFCNTFSVITLTVK